MKCIHCGSVLDPDAKFCTGCGTKVTLVPAEDPAPVFETDDIPAPAFEEPMYDAPAFEEPAQEAPARSKGPGMGEKLKGMEKTKLIGLCVGTLFIIIGLVRVMSAGSSLSSASFGADFYTYTYRGIRTISTQLGSIEASLGWVIAAIGAAIDMMALRD